MEYDLSCAEGGAMSFPRPEEIYRPMGMAKRLGRPTCGHPSAHRYDEFPAGYSLAGCAPAEPASASPAGAHGAAEAGSSTIEMQRTADTLLTACLTRGDNPNYIASRQTKSEYHKEVIRLGHGNRGCQEENQRALLHSSRLHRAHEPGGAVARQKFSNTQLAQHPTFIPFSSI